MRDTKLILVLLGILVFIAVGFVLNILKPILLPFVVAFFLSQLFAPINKALRRRGVPGTLAILVVLFLVSLVLLTFAWVVYSSVESFTEALPRYQAKIQGMVDALSARFPPLEAQIREWRWEKAMEISALPGILAATLGSFLVFFNDAFLILLFLVFLLSGSETFPHKLQRALAGHAGRVGEAMRDVEEEVRKYLLTKTLINLANGVLVTILLAAFGVDFALLWGFLTFLAHYIPNVGAIVSAGLTAAFLFLQFSPGKALLVTLLNAALQFAIGHAIEPRVMGTSLDLSPLLVLLALIFWGWLWGPWGMVLAVPMTSMMKIACEHVAPLRPLAVLMSGSAAPEPPQTSVERKTEAGATVA